MSIVKGKSKVREKLKERKPLKRYGSNDVMEDLLQYSLVGSKKKLISKQSLISKRTFLLWLLYFHILFFVTIRWYSNPFGFHLMFIQIIVIPITKMVCFQNIGHYSSLVLICIFIL